jgi:hypothetical protein
MPFEKFEKKGGRHSDAIVSITTAGQITINRTCMDMYLKNAKYAYLYFDKEKGAIGIKATDKDVDNAFKVTSNEIQSNYSISGTAFLKHYSVDFKTSKRYAPSWSDKDGMLIIKVT